MTNRTGILITNTGTPDAPTTSAVRRYLREFLSDRRVVRLPRLLWLPILYLFVLTFRPRKTAALYQEIWTPEGSPMRAIMQRLRSKLSSTLTTEAHEVTIEIGMNYGNPSINDALEKLRAKQINQLIVLPLYPQFSHTTTSSSLDRLEHALRSWPARPTITTIRDYHDHPQYIAALAQSVQTHWQHHDKGKHLLISFHGLPKRATIDDPYPQQCEQTAALLASALKLTPDQWTLCYQSRFGYGEWLGPSTQDLFLELPKRGIKQLDVICPGFSIDCLETLEEIAGRGRHDFIAAGGEELRMIPALNDSDHQINCLTSLINNELINEVHA